MALGISAAGGVGRGHAEDFGSWVLELGISRSAGWPTGLEPATQKHQEKKRDLKPVEPEMPEVEWNRRESKRECADKKRTGRPVNAMDWKTRHHIFERSVVAETAGGATSIGRSCGGTLL